VVNDLLVLKGFLMKKTVRHLFRILFAISTIYTSSNAMNQSLITAAVRGDVDAVTKLLAQGVNPDAEQDARGHTALWKALWWCHADVVQELLHYKADINGKDINLPATLQTAAYQGNSAMVQMLLDLKVNANVSYAKSLITPLMFAARQGHIEVVRLLLANKAEINLQNCAEQTALMEAAAAGHKDIVMLLLGFNADLTLKDMRERTALDLAKQNKHDHIADILTGFLMLREWEMISEPADELQFDDHQNHTKLSLVEAIE